MRRPVIPQRNLKLTVEYDGSHFVGWQIQRRKRSVQGEIERALHRLLGKRARVRAQGRTDAGVHALGQIAQCVTRSKMSAGEIQRALNALLPEDIVIRRVEETPRAFHARFDAKARHYRYAILNRPFGSPLDRHRVALVRVPLDVGLMQQEAKALVGRHDFSAFQATNRWKRNPVRRIVSLRVRRQAGYIIIDIVANSFVHHMVRNIVGTLIEIGRGKLPPGSLTRILHARDRRLAGPTAPPEGLCLVKVKY